MPESIQIAGPEVLAAVRERYECYNRHEFDSMQASYREDAVFDTSRGFPGERPRQGREDIRAYWVEWWEVWGGVRLDPVEVIQGGDDRWVVVIELGSQGKRSGVDVSQQMAFVYTLADGLIARADLFPDREAALAALRF